MSRAHTQSLFRQVGPQLNARDFRAICPVVFNTDALSAAGLFGVKGIVLRNGGALDLETRWATLTRKEVKDLVSFGVKNNLIHACRAVSHVAGNRYGAGSEDAYVISLTGSPEAEALAKEYGCNYEMTLTVGTEAAAVDVTHVNPIIITMSAAVEALGVLQAPSLDKATTRPSRGDTENPSLQALLAYADANNNAMPQRMVAQAASRVDPDFAKLFPSVGQRRGRTYTNAAPQAVSFDEEI